MARLASMRILLLFFHGGAALELQSLAVTPLSPPPDLPEENNPARRTSHFPLLQLHHRDSLQLLASPDSTPEALFLLRLQRDVTRAATLESRATGGLSGDVVSGLSQGSGEYFTSVGIGTPPSPASLVLDTGSDVVWVQCAPCLLCYSQNDPLFDPNNSRSYAAVRCDAPLCRHLHPNGCTRRCLYRVIYGDGSLTVGDFATETLTFGGGARVAGVGFGCGHANSGLFVGTAGVLGLGRGELSFPSQIGRKYGGRFSYCLMDRISGGNGSSTLIFGAPAGSALFTPMVVNPHEESFYYVEMTGVSVGGTRVAGVRAEDLRLDTATGKGGVVVDSGTSVTRLVGPAYVALRDAFRAGAAGLGETRNFSLFDTCYDLSGMTEVRVPTVVLHFRGDGGPAGADMVLPAANYMVPVTNDPVFCFAFAGSEELSIIGNIQQQGFRVVFDGDGSRVGFVPNSC